MSRSTILIKIARDFSLTPGPRLIAEGNHSGEKFRNEILAPKFKEAVETGSVLVVDLDGTFGYGTSFLEEAFGGLIRENHWTLQDIKAHLSICSVEESDLVDEVDEYLNDAENERLNG